MRVLQKILLLSRESSRGLALPEPPGLETAFWERLPAPGHQRAWVPVYVTIASYLHDPLKISVSSPRTLGQRA